MTRRKKKPLHITAEAAQKAAKSHNFWTAFRMLCEKIGKLKEYHWYVMKRDADATAEQRKMFIKKITRLLAYNYDVHRCPMPSIYGTLKKAGEPGAQPLNYPPEWHENEA